MNPAINRRQFVSIPAVALAVPRLPAAPAPAQIKLGCQSEPSDEKHFGYFARYGVRNICAYPATTAVDDLKRVRDLAASHGISVDCIGAPFLTSSHIDKEKHPAIMLAESPERDRDIETVQTLIRNCAEAGIPAIKYNMSILGVLRTGRVPGRGDASYSMWRLNDAHPTAAL